MACTTTINTESKGRVVIPSEILECTDVLLIVVDDHTTENDLVKKYIDLYFDFIECKSNLNGVKIIVDDFNAEN